MRLLIKRLENFAGFDAPAHNGDAGYDVYSTEDVFITSLERGAIPLGIAVEFPKGYMARVEQKSGNSLEHGFTTIGNVIDSTYRGEIHAIVVNISPYTVHIKKGMKVAQLVFLKVENPEPRFVTELNGTSRGSDGFGSTTKED